MDITFTNITYQVFGIFCTSRCVQKLNHVKYFAMQGSIITALRLYLCKKLRHNFELKKIILNLRYTYTLVFHCLATKF